jgi:hypothetical protein
MSSSITISESAFNKTMWGVILKLTEENYEQSTDDMILILSAIRVDTMVAGDDPDVEPLAFDFDNNCDDWKAEETQAASMIRLSHSPEVQQMVQGMRKPHELWNILQTSQDRARSYIGREDILCHFQPCRPNDDKLLKAYITRLSNYRKQSHHTDDAITDRDYCTQIFTSLPSQYAMILMVLRYRRPLPKPQEAMHDHLEEETTSAITKEHGDASTWAALFSPGGRYYGQGRGRRYGCGAHGGSGGHVESGGSGDSHECMCT